MVALGGVAGNHFTEEAGEEELSAEEDGDEGQVEERLVGDLSESDAFRLANQFLDDQPDVDDGADHENQRADAAEQVHRFLAEFLEEPDGQQVEEAVDETVHAELALTVFARLVMHHLFSYVLKTGILGQIWDETVHLAVDLDVLHYIIAIGF